MHCCMGLLQPKCIFLFYLIVYMFNVYSLHPFTITTPTPKRSLVFLNDFTNNLSNCKIEHDLSNTLQICVFSLGIITLSLIFYLHLFNQVRYVCFDTNLNLLSKNKSFSQSQLLLIPLSFFILGLLLEVEDFVFFVIHINPNFGFVLCDLFLLHRKRISRTIFNTLPIYIFSISFSPASCFLSLVIFQIWTLSFKNVPYWLSMLLILMSNDIHMNPGPQSHYTSNFFSFMNWNLNSLTKDNFHRVDLIEAHNSIFNYDLISVCETNLNDSVDLPDNLLNDYTFEPANHPSNVKHGGVGLFYKNSLPVNVRRDLSFDESIVVELKFGRKKIFFTVLYRSPSFNHTSTEFQTFLQNFKNLNSKIKSENPFAMFFVGDFNGKSHLWWPDGDENPEGREIEDMFTSLGLSQLISEPTNFEPGKNPSCIDLIVTDQPNIVLDSGTRSSIDPFCHHQIIYCKVNFRIPPPLPFERKVWHFNRANMNAIKRSMTNFPWLQHLSLNNDPNWQVKTFTDIVLNIISNFVPNEIKRFVPRDPPWITKPLKNMLNRKNRLYKSYKRHGYKEEDKIRLDSFRSECHQAVENAKLSYLTNLGNKVNDPNTSQKSYWKIINRVMNKSRAPKVPPLILNNEFIVNCGEKAKIFNNFFSDQCRLITNDSILPTFNFLTDKRIDQISIRRDEIVSLVRNLNPNKASGSDGLSGQMLLLCDDSVGKPLKIIFENILLTSLYPDMWKVANVTPVFKKGDKQVHKNYRPISLLPICGKIFEKIIFNNLYRYLNGNNLITKNQSGFRPGDSTTNQLLILVDEIHQAFEHRNSLEVRAVFLDISKAFDKVWHDGLIFKLKQNGISGRLLRLFENYLQNRKQRVALNGSFSDYSKIESGVPQGSVLGPLLFLVYINDLELNIKSNIKFFADDTMLFSIVQDPVVSANDLNHDLEIIYQWAHQWKMEFNPDANKQATEVLFSCKKVSPNHPQLLFNGSVVKKVDEQKHLGLILDSSLSFRKHFDEKIIKAKRIIGIIKYLSKFLPLKTLDQMYKALVRSHLDYCDIIYHIPPAINPPPQLPTFNCLMEKLERVQYQAALAVTGAWQGSNCSKLNEELGWESLSDRRMIRRILQIHKIMNNKTPSYLRNKLPPNHRHFLHNVFRAIKCKTDRYKNSFFPHAIDSWNIIITHFENFPSFEKLKKHVLSLLRPKNRGIFGVHDPVGLRYLFQLRVKLSPLRCHKRHHNFEDTPSDICFCNQGVEDTHHFFLLCPFYVTHRVRLMNSVNEILLNNNLPRFENQIQLLLYGNDSLNYADNKNIIIATLKYIKDTHRFSK